jgi:hypothetical protein
MITNIHTHDSKQQILQGGLCVGLLALMKMYT